MTPWSQIISIGEDGAARCSAATLNTPAAKLASNMGALASTRSGSGMTGRVGAGEPFGGCGGALPSRGTAP